LIRRPAPAPDRAAATARGADRSYSQTPESAGFPASYDGINDLTSESTAQGAVSYTYDNAGRRQTMTVPGPSQASYTRDDANRLTGITQGSMSVAFQYDNANRRTQLTLPNGVTVAYSYDSDSRVSGITYTAGSTQLGGPSCSYDADGRRTAVGGSLAQTNLPTGVSGNTFNADNAMTKFNGTSMSYDSVGELTSDGTNAYTWNARHELTQIKQGRTVTAAFAYDAFGRRESKSIGASTTDFPYDGLNPVQEQSSGGSITANLLTGLNIDEFFTRTASGTISTFLADALGSTIGLVTSSGGPIATSYTYEPFGATTQGGASNTNPYQFTGRENDDTELYYYRARYYSAVYQRFLSQDPLGLRTGPNLYEYVFGDPPNFGDPTGLITGQIGGAVNVQWGPLSGVLSIGFAIDGSGNVGFYFEYGGSFGTGGGVGASAGVDVGTSNGSSICDLGGLFASGTGTVGAGIGGSATVFAGGSPDGPVLGGDTTYGAGFGAGVSVGATNTIVVPLGRL
jgi:RHS repeat-associated protein